MKSVVVVVLSWNKPREVLDCIDRLAALTGADVHVVVVDNASSDDSVDAIRGAHPEVTLIEEPVNVGFAGGVNRGLAEAARRGADFAWLLNDDTSFDASVLVPLLAQAEADSTCGLLSPELRDLGAEAAPQFCNGLVDWDRAVMMHNVPDARYRLMLAAGATAIVPGTAMLCDLRLYRAIGPFDERFFAYWEDTDYAVRAARAGYTSRVVADVPMQHAAPLPQDRPPHYHYYMVRNEALFWRLHYRGNASMRWKRRWLAGTLERIAQNRDLGRMDNAIACIDGLWHAWTRRYGARSGHPPAPRWLRSLLLARPYLFSSVVDGDFGELMKRLVRRP